MRISWPVRCVFPEVKIPRSAAIVLTVLSITGFPAFGAEKLSAPNSDEIVAALPVIPDKNFNFADFGGVGDGKTFNTDAFKKAIAEIGKAGGGHLILAAGTYKVQFQDCSGGGHVTEWYNNRPDMSSADVVTITQGSTTPNINAQLA